RHTRFSRDWSSDVCSSDLEGGNELKVFDTDVGKIGILICYDVEFPELSRLLAERGMQILFVPYWVDTKQSYLRVRQCAQARAIRSEERRVGQECSHRGPRR